MGQIYTQAKKTHIWLGKGDDDMPKIFAFFRAITLMTDATRDLEAQVRLLFTEVMRHASLKPLEQLLHLSWFERRWIIQEAALSSNTTVRCGISKLPWATFIQALSILRKALTFDEEPSML
jgi:hypothetical protein